MKDSKTTLEKRKKLTKNALTHGVYASELLLPWESRKDLLELHRAVRDEWDPQTATEEETVMALTRYYWMKRRNQRSAQIAALRDPLALELGESGEKTWRGIRRHLKARAQEEGEASRPTALMFLYIMSAFRSTSSRLNEKNLDDGERNRLMSELERLQAMLKRCMDLKATMEAQIKTPETSFHAAYDPEHIERTVRIDAMLDARVDRTITRLISLREYRNLTAQRELGYGGTKLLPAANQNHPQYNLKVRE